MSKDNTEPQSAPLGRRRLLSALGASAGLIFLSGADASHVPSSEWLAALGAKKLQGGGPAQFPTCPPFNQYSDGTDCNATFTCASFQCEGGTFDDFECRAVFTCNPLFQCVGGFDGADCDPPVTGFTCTGTFGCPSSYTPEPI